MKINVLFRANQTDELPEGQRVSLPCIPAFNTAVTCRLLFIPALIQFSSIPFKHSCQSILVKRVPLDKLQDIFGQLRPAAG